MREILGVEVCEIEKQNTADVNNARKQTNIHTGKLSKLTDLNDRYIINDRHIRNTLTGSLISVQCIEFGGQYSLLMFIILYTIIVIVDGPFGQKFATLKDHYIKEKLYIIQIKITFTKIIPVTMF